jgi:hypothetical protein
VARRRSAPSCGTAGPKPSRGHSSFGRPCVCRCALSAERCAPHGSAVEPACWQDVRKPWLACATLHGHRAGARALCRTLYRARCAALACRRAHRPLGAPQRCVRPRPSGARLDRSASQRTLASAAPASGAYPSTPRAAPLTVAVARGSARGAFGSVYYAAVPPPMCARARAAWSALMREQVLGPHKLALMAVGSSRCKPTGR